VITVLVVDDHAVVQAGLAAILTSARDLQCVGTVGDAAGALELVERLAPDVVLLDVSMPGGDGVSVTRELRRRGLPVRILVLTSFSDPDLVVDIVQAGADGYLLKENEAETILDGVRAVAAGRAPVDPTVARSLLAEVRGRAAPGNVLTEREREVLELVREGNPNRFIARRLQITERTVKAHVTHIFQRIGVTDRTQAALWAERHLHNAGVPGERS
jgi:DNA-binding NarL/FixJ family response regulator